MNVVLQICVSKSLKRIVLALEPANSSNGNLFHMMNVYSEFPCLFVSVYKGKYICNDSLM